MGNASRGQFFDKYGRRGHRIDKRKWERRFKDMHPKTWGYFAQICRMLGKNPV